MSESISLPRVGGASVNDGADAPRRALTFDVPPDDDEAVEAWVDRLPRERVVEALHIATKMRRMFSQFERMATSRIVADGILSQAEVWTSPEGVDYFWSGDRHREVTDVEGLKDALRNLLEFAGVSNGSPAHRAFVAAFKKQPDKVYLSELDRIEKFGPATAHDIIRDFATWKEGGPKLRPVEGEKHE